MSEVADWQPSAPIANLLQRAKIVAEIRRFFTERCVLEVETPAMSQATITDIHLVPFKTRFVGPGAAQGIDLYLMTSPEDVYKRQRHINWYLAVHIFLIAVPGAITFYAMNLSSSLIREYLNIGGLKSLYSLVLSSLLLVFIAVCAWLTDKYSSAEKIYRIGVIGTILFSVPLYFMMTSQMIGWVFFALLSMMVFATMILCNWAYMMAVKASAQATELGIGYNVSSTIIGGATPLVVSYLVGMHLTYVGGFVALCCLTLLVSNRLPKPQTA